MDYETLYDAYYQAFTDRGVPHFEASQLADGMAATGGVVPPSLQVLAQYVTATYLNA
jgi:hypothetical protein